MSQAIEPAAALSRRLALADVPPEGVDIQIIATAQERAALAEFNALPSIASFEAKLHARRWRADGLTVKGDIRARLTQTCVMTMENFESDILEPVELRFAAPPKAAAQNRRRRESAPEAPASAAPLDVTLDDPPEPLLNGAVDLGAVASEFFTLALDPYPRKPGAAFVEPASESAEAKSPATPFAALRDTGRKPLD